MVTIYIQYVCQEFLANEVRVPTNVRSQDLNAYTKFQYNNAGKYVCTDGTEIDTTFDAVRSHMHLKGESEGIAVIFS